MTLDVTLVRRILIATADRSDSPVRRSLEGTDLERYDPEVVDRHVQALGELEMLVAVVPSHAPGSGAGERAVPVGLTPRGAELLASIRFEPVWRTLCQILNRIDRGVSVEKFSEVARRVCVLAN